MGDSLLVTSGRNTTMLKTLAVVCLAAVAFGEPEAKADADPYLLYGGYGLGYSSYHYPYTGYGFGYYGKRSADAEPKADADPYLLYGGYHGLGYARYGLHYPAYGGYAYYGKRSADAEAKADPYVYGGYYGFGGLGYHGGYGFGRRVYFG